MSDQKKKGLKMEPQKCKVDMAPQKRELFCIVNLAFTIAGDLGTLCMLPYSQLQLKMRHQ